MNDAEARRLIETTFNKPYDETRFRRLIVNLLEVEPRNEKQSGSYIYEAFRDYVTSYQRTGKFTDADGNELDTLAVKLKSARMLERNRTTQRNFVAEYLKRRGKDAALVAFYADDAEDWRFSLIKLEYTLTETKTGRLSAKTDLTPARRYSFLVGQHEPNHTAQKQLVSLLTHPNPTLRELEAQFSIENVTKAFFEEYKARYLELQETLDALLAENEAVRGEFAAKNIDTTTFAKRLLGQIVFLYFLQKKGWLGVGRGEAWGSGPKDFLQRLFSGDIISYTNFYDDVLEPLFYDALAREHTDNYSPHLKRRVPFLNGGLFEPINNYDWVNVDIPLPNTLFERVFKTFSTYNFTVREDEPLEREVAVDPEMLGKVFENLLEVTDRKSKGAFYTPREIVHYMCQESLINYLDTSLNTVKKPLAPSLPTQDDLFGTPQPRQESLYQEVYEERVPRADLESFIRLGDASSEHDATTAQKERETTAYSFKASESVRDHAPKIDAALAAIKICDPAIGSGAFPVGMMNEIVRSRAALTPFLTGEARTLYDFKRHAIQESLYGVDIDESAVDIAKLRLWLSLVVDEDDFGTIKPLPNLAYKIVAGNSVLSLAGAMVDDKEMRELERLKREYFDETRSSRKKDLEARINSALRSVFSSAQDFGAQATFDFRIHFSEVFHAQGSKPGGFDVVIGNPPYVRQEALGDLKPLLKDKYEAYHGSADLFVYFIELGVKLLKKGGTFSYIVANKWMRANYGKPLRTWLKKQQLLTIIDYGDLPVFETATTYPCILFIGKDKPGKEVRVVKMEELAFDKLNAYVEEHGYKQAQAELDDGGWSLANQDVQKVLDKINKVGVPLEQYVNGKIYRGVLTGLNEAFVIDEATRAKLIAEDAKSAEVIKPFLAGRDVKRYQPPQSDKYLILFPNGWTNEHSGDASDKWVWLQKEYLAVAKHLQPFEKQAKKRYDQGEYWWELRACAYYDKFEKPKIIIPAIVSSASYTFDKNCAYSNDKTSIISVDDLYLLGILNSKVSDLTIFSVSSTKRGGYYEYKPMYVSQLPIRTIDFSNPADKAAHDRMTGMVEAMLELQGQKAAQKATASGDALIDLNARITELDASIDALVYELYGLTDEEIKIVEGAP